ncbi:hypothetical protein GCM10009751_37340 [Myceligenerans crystallogenes]|uniref:HNH endonuclease n=2 Tax=Myceligenerans crystallogenes TaxID=316335 RepID=A0ABN2NLK9_9MICO
MTGLQRWAARPDIPDLLPGEDRNLGSGLFVDLVPASCWFTNVRSCVSEKDWERLRRMITRRAQFRCEVCGAGEDRETRRWLEAHERWTYDDAARTQRLARLICLCTDCHTATHFGRAQVVGVADAALVHLRAVTGMNQAEADAHIAEAFHVWEERSRWTWDLDLSILTDAGVAIRRPPSPERRSTTARQTLEWVDHDTRSDVAERAKSTGIQQRAATKRAGSGTGPAPAG